MGRTVGRTPLNGGGGAGSLRRVPSRRQPKVPEPMKARVHVTLKNGVLDPQGKAIQHALDSLGFGGVEEVRQGKLIELELAETDAGKARAAVEEMCRKLLANTVIENYSVEVEG